MKLITYDGTSYVTARQLEKHYQLSRKRCWAILSKARGYMRTTTLGNTPLYAFEDAIAFFRHVDPRLQASQK